MATKLSDLMAELPEEDLKDVRKRSRVHLKAMEDARCLDEIRRAANKRQGEIAMAMGIGQNAVSQLEKRRDIQLSTLNRYVESVGFRLELSVVAPSGERVALKKFKPWDEPQAPKATKPRADAKVAASSAAEQATGPKVRSDRRKKAVAG
jgi:transcriptional regulator with XRE-family HTH domain